MLDPTGHTKEFLRKRYYVVKDKLRKQVREYNELARNLENREKRIARNEAILNIIELELGVRR